MLVYIDLQDYRIFVAIIISIFFSVCMDKWFKTSQIFRCRNLKCSNFLQTFNSVRRTDFTYPNKFSRPQYGWSRPMKYMQFHYPYNNNNNNSNNNYINNDLSAPPSTPSPKSESRFISQFYNNLSTRVWISLPDFSNLFSLPDCSNI